MTFDEIMKRLEGFSSEQLKRLRLKLDWVEADRALGGGLFLTEDEKRLPKVAAIKSLRGRCPWLGLKDAYDFITNPSNGWIEPNRAESEDGR